MSGCGVVCYMEVVWINGNLMMNDGEIVVKWVFDGYGILMCVEWDLCDYFVDGWLVVVLLDYEMLSVDIYVVYV